MLGWVDFKEWHGNHIHHDNCFCNNRLGKMCIHKSMEVIQMQNEQLRGKYQFSLPAKDSECCAELFSRLLSILVVQRRNSKTTVLLCL